MIAPEEIDDLPQSMREAARWLVWKEIPVPGKKPRKVPFYANGKPRHGVLDTPEDWAQLAPFDQALAALRSEQYTGLGFALGPDGTGNHWQGIDLDGVAAHPGLKLIADDLPGYTETSPSGQGVHAIGYGRRFPPLGSNGTGIEAYSSGRYFTVTGAEAGVSLPECLADFVDRVLKPKHTVAAATIHSAEVVDLLPAVTLAELRSALAAMRSDDRDLWVANGQRLKRLGESGRALWIEWSQQSDKFDPADAARVWDSFTADRTGHQAIFADAQRRGWINPLSGSVPTPAQPVAPSSLLTTLTNQLTPFTGDELAAAAIPHPHAFMSPDGRTGLFPVGEVTVIGAPGREGKTSAVMAIAVHYSLGWSLGGMAPLEVQSCLIYSAEDDRAQYARKAAAQHSKLSADNAERFRKNLIVPELHGPELAAWREIVRMEARQPVRGLIVEPLIEAILALKTAECPLGLVIFETASTLSDAEEDNPGHKTMIGALKHLAKSTGVAVILVHHTSQAAANNLPDLNISEADIRGGTTLVNNARQTHLLVNLASTRDPFPDGDARAVLRSLVAPGETERVTGLICLSSSKCAEPTPLFFRWEDTPHYGPRLVEIDPPKAVAGKSWRAMRALLAGAKAEARADKKAEAGQANVRLVVGAVEAITLAGEQATSSKVSAKCGRSPTWAKPYLTAAVESGELVRSTEQVPRAVGYTDVYRLAGGAHPWQSTPDPTATVDAPWSDK